MANVLQANNYMELAFAILHFKAYVHVWPNLCGALMANVWMQAKKPSWLMCGLYTVLYSLASWRILPSHSWSHHSMVSYTLSSGPPSGFT